VHASALLGTGFTLYGVLPFNEDAEVSNHRRGASYYKVTTYDFLLEVPSVIKTPHSPSPFGSSIPWELNSTINFTF
jgi:hypothetical protein